jgi:GAF domain-containing protein
MAEAFPSNIGPGLQTVFPAAVLATPDVEDFLGHAIREFGHSIGDESRAVLWAVTLVRGGTTRTWVAGSAEARQIDALHGSFDDGPLRAAVRSGEFVHVADLAIERRWPGYATILVGHGVASLLTVPMMVGGEIGAAITLYAPIPHAFTSDDIASAGACARRIAAAIQLLLQLAQRAEVTAVQSPLSLVELAVWSLMREYGFSREAAIQHLQAVVQDRAAGLPDAGITTVLPGPGLNHDGGSGPSTTGQHAAGGNR